MLRSGILLVIFMLQMRSCVKAFFCSSARTNAGTALVAYKPQIFLAHTVSSLHHSRNSYFDRAGIPKAACSTEGRTRTPVSSFTLCPSSYTNYYPGRGSGHESLKLAFVDTTTGAPLHIC